MSAVFLCCPFPLLVSLEYGFPQSWAMPGEWGGWLGLLKKISGCDVWDVAHLQNLLAACVWVGRDGGSRETRAQCWSWRGHRFHSHRRDGGKNNLSVALFWDMIYLHSQGLSGCSWNGIKKAKSSGKAFPWFMSWLNRDRAKKKEEKMKISNATWMWRPWGWFRQADEPIREESHNGRVVLRMNTCSPMLPSPS